MISDTIKSEKWEKGLFSKRTFQFWKEVIYSVGLKEKKIPGKHQIKTCYFFDYLYS